MTGRSDIATSDKSLGKQLRRASCPLPAPLLEDVIELLSTLLLEEIQRNPELYRTDPDGGPTVTLP